MKLLPRPGSPSTQPPWSFDESSGECQSEPRTFGLSGAELTWGGSCVQPASTRFPGCQHGGRSTEPVLAQRYASTGPVLPSTVLADQVLGHRVVDVVGNVGAHLHCGVTREAEVH